MAAFFLANFLLASAEFIEVSSSTLPKFSILSLLLAFFEALPSSSFVASSFFLDNKVLFVPFDMSLLVNKSSSVKLSDSLSGSIDFSGETVRITVD